MMAGVVAEAAGRDVVEEEEEEAKKRRIGEVGDKHCCWRASGEVGVGVAVRRRPLVVRETTPR